MHIPATTSFDISFDAPWLGTTPQMDCHDAHFALSTDGLHWYPRQLERWSRSELFLLVSVLNRYAHDRTD